jgi:peroxiredoxin
LRWLRAWIALSALLLAGSCTRAAPREGGRPSAREAAEGDELVGTQALPWRVTDWLGSPPLTLEALRGKVVLVRWWMAPSCPYCSATAPSLRALDDELRDRGLVVIGFYHHKGAEPLDKEAFATYARHYGFRFPVAIDPEWRTLNDWWLRGHDRTWTSVTFVIDRRGTIRLVHPGGAYAPESAGYERIRAVITGLLAEGT